MIGTHVIKTRDGRPDPRERNHITSHYHHKSLPREDLERMADERREFKRLKTLEIQQQLAVLQEEWDMCNGGVFAVMDDCNNMILLLLDCAHVDRDSDYNGNGCSNEGIEEVMYSVWIATIEACISECVRYNGLSQNRLIWWSN
eukprot:512211_1